MISIWIQGVKEKPAAKRIQHQASGITHQGSSNSALSPLMLDA